MKRKNKNLPAYTHTRSSFAGISERLALASLAFSKTWKATPNERQSYRFEGDYMHSVRFLSKKEGWETNFTWRDNCDHIDLNQRGVKRAIAIGIEGARAAWYESKKPPTEELLKIITKIQERKQAA